MDQSKDKIPIYNLWDEAWIGIERVDGSIGWAGIGETLCDSHQILALYDPSPLVVAGIHRLLIAVLQAALQPESNRELEQLWKTRCFPEEPIVAFEQRYGGRFELFSLDQPFLQSADLTLKPAKGDPVKTVAYLMPDIPSGTAITHYRHGGEESHRFCPACAAGGLTIMPAFATSGGAGIKPSINGVPPLYILPGGKNLFESLAASLLQPGHFPAIAPDAVDRPWWDRPAMVPRSSEVAGVGYLHSLTFPARRVRLHPEYLPGQCTRCGRESTWQVRTMIYEMGECQSDGAPVWMDPFAAYRLPDSDKGKLTPIRPSEGKATWREFGGLFLRQAGDSGPIKKRATKRPQVLEQITDLFADDPDFVGPGTYQWSFRCIGMRTDMKAKVFEWVDTAFEVPLVLLMDPDAAGREVDGAVQMANDCASILSGSFREAFNDKSRKSDRYTHPRLAMLKGYWTKLAVEFRTFVLALDPGAPAAARRTWAEGVVKTARLVFWKTLEGIPDDAATLRRKVEAEQKCSGQLINRLKKENLDE